LLPLSLLMPLLLLSGAACRGIRGDVAAAVAAAVAIAASAFPAGWCCVELEPWLKAVGCCFCCSCCPSIHRCCTNVLAELMAEVQLHHMPIRSPLGFDGTVEAATCPAMVCNRRHACCCWLLLAAAAHYWVSLAITGFSPMLHLCRLSACYMTFTKNRGRSIGLSIISRCPCVQNIGWSCSFFWW